MTPSTVRSVYYSKHRWWKGFVEDFCLRALFGSCNGCRFAPFSADIFWIRFQHVKWIRLQLLRTDIFKDVADKKPQNPYFYSALPEAVRKQAPEACTKTRYLCTHWRPTVDQKKTGFATTCLKAPENEVADQTWPPQKTLSFNSCEKTRLLRNTI